MFTFNIEEKEYSIDSSKEDMSTFVKKVKAEKNLYDEFNKYVDGKSDKKIKDFSGFIDFDIIYFKVLEDKIVFSGDKCRRMFFMNNSFVFLGKEKLIYKKGVCISLLLPYFVGILGFAIYTSLITNIEEFQYSPLCGLIYLILLLGGLFYNYYKTKKESKEVDCLFNKILSKKKPHKYHSIINNNVQQHSSQYLF